MFAKRLKDLRKQKGLTQEELAKAIGIPRSTLANYESGAAKPKFEVAEAFADFFNVSLDSLITQKQIDDYFNELRKTQLKKAIFGTSNISDDKLNEVLEYAKFVKQRGENEWF